MATSIDQAFIKQYEKDVHHVFQREGGFLRPSVRMKTGVVGSSTTFQKVGTGVATTKARHGTVTPMNQTHTAIPCSLSDFYGGDWVDKLDEAKTNIDEKMVVAKGGAWALGRKVDDQITTVLDSTSQPAVTIDTIGSGNIRASLLEWVEALDSNDVPNDGGRYGLMTPRLWSMAMIVDEFASGDFVGGNGLPYTEGAPVSQRWKAWNGVLWKVHSGLPGQGTNAAKCFAYHKNAVGYAAGAHAGNVAANQAVAAEITYHGDRVSHFVNHMMSGGACLIDDAGIIQADMDDTDAIPAT